MSPARRSRHHRLDVWPGFVDALSSMLMVIVMILVFLLIAQFSLTSSLSEKTTELVSLSAKLRALSEALGAERQVSGELSAKGRERERKLAESEALTKDLTSKLQESALELVGEREARQTLEARLAEQIGLLNDQLARLNSALATAESAALAKDIEIKTLSEKLNEAMVSKMEELAQYRSEFFGRLRKALGKRQDIRVVGDRFIFQSEVLFPTASAELEPNGQARLAQLAETLKEIIREIPTDINWVLQIIGHTDIRPINTELFRSNWDLSAARAISVVKFLIEQGVPADRLAASGYGEFQPIDPGSDEQAWAKNRRIEIKLTEK